MKMIMKQTRLASIDGINVIEYREGETYDLPNELAQLFLKEKWAKKIDTDIAEAVYTVESREKKVDKPKEKK